MSTPVIQPKAPAKPAAPPPTGATIRNIRDFSLNSKRVLLRLDFNVPMTKTEEGMRIDDDSRIKEAIPTLQHAITSGARVIIASHLGRPEGRRNPDLSLEPIAAHLAELLNCDVIMADDCVGVGIELLVQTLKPGQIMMLENLRFHREEEANDPEFARDLARLCDVYITDAFGTAHRKHASTYGVPSTMSERGMGFLIEKELKFLDHLLQSSASPFYLVLGGAKVSDKIKTIESLMRRIDGLLIGGAMANAFWRAKGLSLPEGAKAPRDVDVEAASLVLNEAKKREVPVILPTDTNDGFDIGPKTITEFKSFLAKARTVFWNGPLGMFEKPEYGVGTREIAETIAGLDAVKVVGGGDTVFAVRQAGMAEKFNHLSTGGGAVLEYLEGEGLPGIDVLKTYPREMIQSPYLS